MWTMPKTIFTQRFTPAFNAKDRNTIALGIANRYDDTENDQSQEPKDTDPGKRISDLRIECVDSPRWDISVQDAAVCCVRIHL